MRTRRIWMMMVVMAVSANCFARPQATTGKSSAKKMSSAEEKTPREIYGKIESFKGTQVTLKTRTGENVQVDAKAAMEAQRSVPLVVGRAIAVKGTVDKAGVVHAEMLQRAKDSVSMWPADR